MDEGVFGVDECYVGDVVELFGDLDVVVVVVEDDDGGVMCDFGYGIFCIRQVMLMIVVISKFEVDVYVDLGGGDFVEFLIVVLLFLGLGDGWFVFMTLCLYD